MLGRQPTGGLTAHVGWLGLTESRQLPGADLCSSDEPGELLQ